MSSNLNQSATVNKGEYLKSLSLMLNFVKLHWFLVVALLVQGFLFASAWRSFYKTWSTQDFSHGVAIIPIAIFLAWRMKAQLRQYIIEPSYVWLLGLVSGAGIWFAGHITATSSVMQFGAIVGVIFTILSFIGAKLGRVAWFPLFFLLLILPFGGWLTPYLTELTADAVHAGLQLLGIPVYREGEDFVLPTGRWSVVSACSGLRFVLSAVVLSFLYAHLNFKKLSTSIKFIIFTLAASVLANWVRALLTVLLGHATHMRFGPGEEHLWLGWVIFGLVMWAVFWFASRWRDTDDGLVEVAAPHQVPKTPAALGKSPLIVLALSILICATFSFGAKLLVVPASESTVKGFSALTIAGAADLSKLDYEPDFAGWSALKRGVVSPDQSQFLMAYFVGQANSASMLGLVNQVIPDDEKNDWKMQNLQTRDIPGLGFPVREFIATSVRTSVRVQYWFTVGGAHTASPVQAKVLTLKNVLIGRGDGSVLNLVVHKKISATSDLKDAELLKNIAAASSSFTSERR
jgi:exosortase A